jgi:Fe-S-cluster containining protein
LGKDEVEARTYKLRDDLDVEHIPRADLPSYRVRDAICGRRYWFDEKGQRILHMIREPRTLAEIAAALGVEKDPGGMEGLREFLQSLSQHNLLEEPGTAEIVTRIRETEERRRTAEPADVPFLFLGDSRHSCYGCGSCCQQYALGPVTDDEVERISRAGLEEKYAQLQGKDLFYRIPKKEGEGTEAFITTVGDDHRCIFQLPDRRCIIHAELGYEAKARVCKAFPYMAVTTLKGIIIANRGECAMAHRAFREGALLAENIDTYRDIFLEEVQWRPLHPPVTFSPRLAIGFDAYLALEEQIFRLLSLADAEGRNLEETLFALRNLLGYFFASALKGGIPEALGKLVASEEGEFEAFFVSASPAAGARAFHSALFQVLGLIFTNCNSILFGAMKLHPSEVLRRVPLRVVIQAVHILLTVLSEHLDGEDRVESDFFKEVRSAAFPLDAPELKAFLMWRLREYVFGKRLVFPRGHVVVGFVTFFLEYLIAKWAAKMKAVMDGLGAPRIEELSFGMILTGRVLWHSYFQGLLAERDEEIQDLFNYMRFF